VLDKPTLKRPRQAPAEEAPPVRAGQTKPAEQRFVVRVDGQPKCSFSDKEAAKQRGQEIKKAFPVVVVSVVDTREGVTEVIHSSRS